MDGFFGIGLPELFMIAVIALIVLGPERLPGTIREVAKFIKQVRAIGSELMSQFGDEFKEFQDLDPRRILNEMTDPTKPDDKSKAAPTTKPATNTVSKPATTTTSTAASAAKSTAAVAVSNSNSASKNESKVESKSNGAAEVKPASEQATTDQSEANKSAEVVPAPTNTIAPPTALATSVTPTETAIASNNSGPGNVVDVQTVAVVTEAEPGKSDSPSAEAVEVKPKRTRKAKSKVPLESVEQSVEQPEGEVPHESAN